MDGEPKKQEPEIPLPVAEVEPEQKTPEIPPDKDAPEKKGPVQAKSIVHSIVLHMETAYIM